MRGPAPAPHDPATPAVGCAGSGPSGIRTVKVDNAQAVSELNDNGRFEMPAGIDIWSPSNGAVVTLKPIP